MMFDEYRSSGYHRHQAPKPGAVRHERISQKQMAENFFEETALIGIVSSLEPYRLCWRLNKALETDFCCMPELTVMLQVGNEQPLFPVFQYKIPNSNISHIIYKLKSGNHYLLPDFKKKKFLDKLDYLWLIQSSAPDKDATIVNEQLKTVDDIVLSTILQQEFLKDHLNLLL